MRFRSCHTLMVTAALVAAACSQQSTSSINDRGSQGDRSQAADAQLPVADLLAAAGDSMSAVDLARFDVPASCGDGVCQITGTCAAGLNETCLTCPQDCGACEWKLATGELPAGLHGIWGSSPADIFVVGDTGSVSMGHYIPALFHFNGSSWTTMTAPYADGPSPWRVWGSSSSNVWVAAGWGGILHYDGSIWTSASSPVYVDMGGIWGTAASDVWIVGGNWWGGSAAVFHYDGKSWTSMTIPDASQYYLNDVWASSPSDVFAVGNTGVILHYDGLSWKATKVDVTDLSAVWGSSSSDVFAAGGQSGSSTILHFDGTSWSTMWKSASTSVNDLWGTGPSNVFAVGGNGTILQYDGKKWGFARADLRTPGTVSCPALVNINSAGTSRGVTVGNMGSKGFVYRYCPNGVCP